MDFGERPSVKSPKPELLGPRPAPIKVSKDSHKIKKPPPRPPVIIYAVSPKIIHAEANEFMSLVQRLTGQTSSIPLSDKPSSSIGAMSPAAMIASIEKTKLQAPVYEQNLEFLQGIEIGQDVQIGNQFPGILSPNPNLLPPIPRNIFSPTPDSANPLNFFSDLSPFLRSTRNQQNQFEDFNSFNIFPSPSTSFSPQFNINSPSTFNLLRSLFDL